LGNASLEITDEVISSLNAEYKQRKAKKIKWTIYTKKLNR
jgi:hypothetical protein